MSAARKQGRKGVTPQKPVVAEETPVAVVEETRTAPKVKRGNSSIENPVAFVWATCHNMAQKALKAGEPIPSRTAMVNAVIDAGVAYYTARTQVQEYLKASNGGKQVPAKLPRNLKLV